MNENEAYLYHCPSMYVKITYSNFLKNFPFSGDRVILLFNDDSPLPFVSTGTESTLVSPINQLNTQPTTHFMSSH